VYEPLFDQENWERTVNYYLLNGGRNSGKTSVITAFMHFVYEQYSDNDIIVFVPALKSEKDTLKLQLEGYLEQYGLQQGWVFNSKGYVKKRCHKNRIYFYPAQSNTIDQMNVSKGLTTHLPTSLILVDELQKMHGKEIVEQFLNTALKRLVLHGFVIFAMNEERRALWASAYVQEKRNDPACIVIDSTYQDLIDLEGSDLLPRSIREKIERDFVADPILARQMYLNDMQAKGWETVFPTFDRTKHYKQLDEIAELRYLLKNNGIAAMVFGMDFASNHDATVSLPIALTTNNKAVVFCDGDDHYYYSPKESNRIISPSELNKGIIANIKHIITTYNVRIGTPIYLVCDGAAAPNVEELRASMLNEIITMQADPMRNHRMLQFFGEAQIVGYTWKQSKVDNLMRLRGLLSQDGLMYFLHNGTPVERNGVVLEIEAQRYKDDGKLDGRYPNDRVDAWEYGSLYIFNNPESQYIFENIAKINQNQQDALKSMDGAIMLTGG